MEKGSPVAKLVQFRDQVGDKELKDAGKTAKKTSKQSAKEASKNAKQGAKSSAGAAKQLRQFERALNKLVEGMPENEYHPVRVCCAASPLPCE